MKLCNFDVGLNHPLFLIAGPCVIESEAMTLDVAGQLKEITAALNIPFIFKSSCLKVDLDVLTKFQAVNTCCCYMNGCKHGLRTPREEITFTARPKIQSQSQIFRNSRSIFCLPHRPNFSDIFDLYLHWVSVVRVLIDTKNVHSQYHNH